MGIRRHRRWQALGLVTLWLLGATYASAQVLTVSRLDADPLPVQVIAGELDKQFVAVDEPMIRPVSGTPSWWRVTAGSPILASDEPQLLLVSPHLNRTEVWLPGQAMPQRRSLFGADADPRFSTRALVTAIPDGLRTGQSLYLRVHGVGVTPMAVRIAPLEQVHRDDLVHVAWRSGTLVTLVVLSVLALGFWVGIGQRSYAYLLLTLLAQAFYLASSGGELRLLPELAATVTSDPRATRLFAFIAVLASNGFLMHYLELRTRQPRMFRALHACNMALVAMMVVTIVSAASLIAFVANLVLLATTATVFLASLAGARRGQRAAWFVLLSWTPLLVLLVLRVGELLGGWVNAPWMVYAFPATFAMAGLVITVGMADALQQLRRDRDHASHLATYDPLTGAMSRPAIEQRLHTLVADAKQSGRSLSVVFFDVDRFKSINDEHGHRIGDQCLRIISLRTRNRLRTYDLFGRWGGDEVLVLLPDTPLAAAMGVAENLRSAVNCRPLSIDGQLLSASLSLGVAELVADESPEQLIERADAALYASKSAGRDRVTAYQRSIVPETV
ncbi:GGDEF domain-containing protein [Montanilutibacter psychrotolerans]|nr:diguanylate cyclase [Lysobacter psychrotolerans]